MAERSLGTLIHSLQTTSNLDDFYGLLPKATGLLTVLSNPLNISLLSSHILSSPALWSSPDLDLHACRRIIGLYNSAALHIVQREEEEAEAEREKEKQKAGEIARPDHPRYTPPQTKQLKRDEWLEALLNGVNGRASPWRHLLLLGGLLIGMEGQYRQSLSIGMRGKLVGALIETVQAALMEIHASASSASASASASASPSPSPSPPPIAGHCIVLVLTYTWDLLSDQEKQCIDPNTLLILLLNSAFMSEEGLEAGLFFNTVDKDMTVDSQGHHLHWSAQSPSFDRIRSVASRPLVASLGPLSKLLTHCLDRCQPELVNQAVVTLLQFSNTLLADWRQVKLSGVDRSEEEEIVDSNALKTTVPILRQIFKMAFFSTVISLRAVLGRVLDDRILATDDYAPLIATKALHILRNFCFISSLMGTSSQYTFVTLTSIDILSQYPDLSRLFLDEIHPTHAGSIPQHPLDRCLDLYFLNTAEHFSLVLTPEVNEQLLISAALPYLSSGADSRLIEIFEAAHSVVLSVLAAPKSAEMASRYLEIYVNNLFNVFPENLSPRQFRLAYKTILQITAPPSPLANTQPFLPDTLLDMLHDKALRSPTHPLPPQTTTPPQHPDPSIANALTETAAQETPLSEQAVLTLALIDCLCYLDVAHLQEWLPLTAKVICAVPDEGMRKLCQERFWEAMSNGEMDVQRAHFCVTWWSTRGGREAVLFGDGVEGGGEGEGERGKERERDEGGLQPKL